MPLRPKDVAVIPSLVLGRRREQPGIVVERQFFFSFFVLLEPSPAPAQGRRQRRRRLFVAAASLQGGSSAPSLPDALDASAPYRRRRAGAGRRRSGVPGRLTVDEPFGRACDQVSFFFLFFSVFRRSSRSKKKGVERKDERKGKTHPRSLSP